MKPRVFVGSLCFNNAPYIQASAKIIAGQTMPARHFVIDDGSRDDSAARLAATEDRTFEFIAQPDNRGIVRRLNELVQHVGDEEYVSFLCDDYWTPDHLQRSVALLDAAPRAAAVCGLTLLANGAGAIVGALNPAAILRQQRRYELAELFATKSANDATTISGHDMSRALFAANVIPAPSMVFRASALRALLPWDESLPFEDFDMSLRMSREYDWVYSTRATAHYVVHGGNFSTRQRPLVLMGYAATLIKNADAVAEEDRAHVAELAAKSLLDCALVARSHREKLPAQHAHWLREHARAFGLLASANAFSNVVAATGGGALARRLERLFD